MYRKISMMVACFILLFTLPSVIHAEFQETKMFKGKIETVNQIIEWTYENPDTFEYVIQDQRYIGSKAKKEINQLFNALAISKHSSVEDILKTLEDNGYTSITHLDVRWINSDNELYSWVWDKNQ